MRAVSKADLTNDMLIKWLEENITNRYQDTEDIARAFDMLSLILVPMLTKAVRVPILHLLEVHEGADVCWRITLQDPLPRGWEEVRLPKIIKELSASKADRRLSTGRKSMYLESGFPVSGLESLIAFFRYTTSSMEPQLPHLNAVSGSVLPHLVQEIR